MPGNLQYLTGEPFLNFYAKESAKFVNTITISVMSPNGTTSLFSLC